MRRVSKRVKDQLLDDPFMLRCCFPGCSKEEVEWNHALKYAGRQVDEPYAIVPHCYTHHRGKFGTIDADVSMYCEYIAIDRGLVHLLAEYPRSDWEQRLHYLTTIYERHNESEEGPQF